MSMGQTGVFTVDFPCAYTALSNIPNKTRELLFAFDDFIQCL